MCPHICAILKTIILQMDIQLISVSSNRVLLEAGVRRKVTSRVYVPTVIDLYVMSTSLQQGYY